MTVEHFDASRDNGKFKCVSCDSNPSLDGHKPHCPWNCATNKVPPVPKVTNEALDKKATRLDKMLTARTNRSVGVENILIKMSKGDLPLPTKQGCLVLALRLGTPMKDWSDAISNHDFGENDETN